MSDHPIYLTIAKQVLEAGPLNLRLFRGRLSPGPHWQIERTLESHLLYVLAAGKATLHLESGTHSVSAPSALLLTEGISYRLSSHAEAPLSFHPFHFTTQHRVPQQGWQGLHPVSLPDIHPLIETIHTLWKSEAEPGISGASSGLYTLIAALELMQHDKQSPPTHHEGIYRVCETLRHHPEERKTVSELARIAGMGRSNFSYHFKQITGLSPQQYAIRERCRTAEALIREEGFRIGEAATATGYSDPFSFSKQFRAVMGHPPSQKTTPPMTSAV